MKKGSYTIEAAILIPFIFSIYTTAVFRAADLYDKAKRYKSAEALREIDEINTFYIEEILKEVGND